MMIKKKIIYKNIKMIDRDSSFWTLVHSIIKKSNLKEEYIDKILNSNEAKKLYNQVFTHPTIDAVNNYEWLEILGDSTLNKCVVWYISKRFPQLNCPEGVKIIARLKINLISKKTFAEIAMKLNWWEHVLADEETKQTKMKKVLEDVFEAFFGATELLIDSIVYPGSGYAICYRIVVALFNDLDISLSYESLYDPITRLKEVFDYFKDIGTFSFENEKKDGFQQVHLYQNVGSKKILIGFGMASLLDDAKQKACQRGLINLKHRGIEKPIAEYYKKLLLNDV
jgi:dsRNA-specific ribonuclease